MNRKLSPLAGVLLFVISVLPVAAIDSPREILVEAHSIVSLKFDNADAPTNLPDLNALLTLFPGTITRHALDLPPGRHTQFNRFLLLRLSPNLQHRKSELLLKLATLSSIQWAQSNRMFQTNFYPNDPEFSEQWGADRIRVQEAWDVTFGSTNVPIAIIDTGCEMDHPDLVSSIWINQDEIPDNNQDDDGNGFIDDYQGWDFVDAPSFPTGGDYLDRDNDPSDEMGHGTAIAGICGATIDNDIGIAGIAPDCPLMILRAGNSNGFLQEDDVASAILYALDNGARVVNMSFGDIQASPMLEDAIEYAYLNGLMFVAAAGNNGAPTANFPAAFSTVLCVGSCDQNDNRAWDSNYGVSLDLLAPGVEIFSTLMNAEYGLMPPTGSGTSFAVPHASAAAGLVFSLHPDWGPSEAISVLKTSADDVSEPGWDSESGQGILRADKAVMINEALIAEISSPTTGQGFSTIDSLIIVGTASGVYLQNYQVLIGAGENPDTWEPIQPLTKSQKVNDILSKWLNPDPPDDIFTIKLVVTDIFGNQMEDRVILQIDETAPEISNLNVYPILDADRPVYLISFHTDDLTTGHIRLKDVSGSGTSWSTHSLDYETTDHVVLIGRDFPLRLFQYRIIVENTTGDTVGTDIDTLDLTIPSVNSNIFVEMPPNDIPLCDLYEESTDLDQDGFSEIWINTFDEYGGIDELRVYESTESWAFADLGLEFGQEIPKSINDSDGNGLPELLTLYAGNSKIFEATPQGGFPDPENVVWADNSGDMWGAKLLDYIPERGYGEIIFESDKIYHLRQNWGGGQLPWIQELTNPFEVPLVNMPPYCRVNDYDNDGLTEILFGDPYGNVYIYERQPDWTFAVSWSDSLPLLDTGEFITDGDYDGDGEIEFAVLAHTETNLIGEHLADTRYWGLYIYKATGDNQFDIIDTLYFFGAENPSDFASGITSGDIYGDSYPEILLCLYPDLYVVDWDVVEEQFVVRWYYPQCLSNKAVMGDFNRNGHNEFLFNTGSQMKLFEEVGPWSNYLPPPLNFTAMSPDTTRIQLNWSPVPDADKFNVFRGDSPDEIDLLISVPGTVTEYEDFDVEKNTTYYYAIATFRLGLVLGPFTTPIAALANEAPSVPGDTAHFSSPGFITVQFSEPMATSLTDVTRYWIYNTAIQPTSAVSDAGDSRVVLSFDAAFDNAAWYWLVIHQVYDQQGSYFSNFENPGDTVAFFVPLPEYPPPYLADAHVKNKLDIVTVVFSEGMRTEGLSTLGNYQITVDPITVASSGDSIVLLSATPHEGLQNTVYLQIHPDTPIGALGKIYRVTAQNILSLSGYPIDPNHNSAALNFSRSDLSDVFVYPNPYKSGTFIDGEDCVIFANLTSDAEIKILNLSGICIRTLISNDNVTGGIRWYVDNDRGEKVGSGVYIYQVTGGDDSFWGKIAVIR